MNINANTVTIVIAICAILSPILVAVINNWYNFKLKKLEAQQQKEKETTAFIQSVYEHYLQSAGRCIASCTRETEQQYGEHYSIAFIYFPSEFHDSLKNINSAIRDGDWDTATKLLEELAIALSRPMKDILK